MTNDPVTRGLKEKVAWRNHTNREIETFKALINERFNDVIPLVLADKGLNDKLEKLKKELIAEMDKRK